VDIGRRCRISKAVIDSGCQVPEGTVIGENPQDDAKRYYVTPRGVVLVTPDMLGQPTHFVR
jgi:glucose-1-phosphate adenylyltransferase